MSRGRAVLVCCLVVCSPSAVTAHDVSQSESTLSIEGATVRVQLTVNLLELNIVDVNGDQRVSYEELDSRIEDVFAIIKQHFVLGNPRPAARVVMQRQQIADDHMLQADLRYTFDRPVREMRVESSLDTVTSAQHVHHVRADIDGQLHQASLTPANRSVTFYVGGVTIGRILVVLAAIAGLGGLVALRMTSKERR